MHLRTEGNKGDFQKRGKRTGWKEEEQYKVDGGWGLGASEILPGSQPAGVVMLPGIPQKWAQVTERHPNTCPSQGLSQLCSLHLTCRSRAGLEGLMEKWSELTAQRRRERGESRVWVQSLSERWWHLPLHQPPSRKHLLFRDIMLGDNKE